MTGAVGSVTEEELGERPAANVNMAIAGKVPGVQVNVNSGRPGGQTNVRVRGFSSINTSIAPLYVVDGIITNAIDLKAVAVLDRHFRKGTIISTAS